MTIDNVEEHKLTMRNYRLDDLDSIRTMFAESYLDWPDAPYHKGMARLSKHTAISYRLCQFFTGTLGLAITLSPTAARSALQTTSVDITNLLWWGGYFMVITSSLVSAYLYSYRRTVKSMLHVHVKEALKTDLKDPVEAYGLRRFNDDIGFEPTGPSGFWVAEAGKEVIGFISLKLGSDPTTAELCRLTVSPAHQRRGVGSILTNTAVAHAQANGLRVLMLRTSIFHKAARTMYERKGWVLEKRIAYPGFSNWWRFIIIFRKNLV